MAKGKQLEHYDKSGFDFQKELLNGDTGNGINFDILFHHNKYGFVIIELLLCDEKQKTVTPWTSHPSRYWHMNKGKFVGLWKAAQAMGAKLFLVNYAKKGTKYENEILFMEVEHVDFNGIKTKDTKTTREKFAKWYRKFNNCSC